MRKVSETERNVQTKISSENRDEGMNKLSETPSMEINLLTRHYISNRYLSNNRTSLNTGDQSIRTPLVWEKRHCVSRSDLGELLTALRLGNLSRARPN